MAADTGGQRLARFAFLWLGAYFVAHVVLRVLLSDSLELDEAEQVISTQDLRLLYGSQPPLFVWIQALGFELLGLNVLALALTKHLVLFSTYVFVYSSARIATGDARCAVFAALSLLLIPQIAIESHRTLAHSVMVTAVAAATLLAWLRVLERGRSADYALLGLALGLGVLSKYNYLVFAIPMLLATFTIPRFRPALGDRRMLIAAGIMAAVVAPHLAAVLGNPGLAASQSAELKIDAAGANVAGVVLGAAEVLVSVTWLLAGFILVLVALLARAPERTPASARCLDHARLAARAFLIAVGSVLIGVITLRIPDIKDRWFQPLLVLVPVYAVARFGTRIDAARFRWLVAACCVAALAAWGWLFVRTTEPELIGRQVRLNLPLHALADAVRTSGFEGGVIASNRREYSATLRLFFADSIALETDFVSFETPADATWLLVWRAVEGARVPAELEALFVTERGVALPARPPARFEAPYRNSSGPPMAFHYLIVEQ